jgi:uncharacterized protein (TIGR02231 family)
MTRFALAIVFSAIGLGGGGLGGGSLGGESAMAADVTATSAIDAVTVFPSGAEISRLAKVKLVKGEGRIVFPDLPAQAIAGSIRVEGKSTGKLEIGSVDAKRLSVPRSDPATTESERKKLEDQIESLRDTRALFEGQTEAANAQRTLINNLTNLPTIPPQPMAGPQPAPDWKALIATIGTGLVDVKRAELEAQLKIRETDRKITELQGKLNALAPIRQERTEVAVAVTAGADLEADLVVKYQVPSASWTALYDARLSTGGKAAAPKLDLTRRAAIQQTTGEPWTNVTLALSTTRPTVGASAPELRTMTVDYMPDFAPAVAAAPAPVARQMMKQRRDEGLAQDRDAMAAGAMAAPEPVMAEATVRNAAVMQAPFQAVYGVPGRATVAPTGEIKNVQLMEESIEPQLLVRTVPKLDAKAFLYAKLILPKSSAVLPGAVSLFRDGTFVGTGKLPLLAPGEEHELGFGGDDSIRVKHAIAEDKRGEKGLISSSKTDTRNYKITVKNLHQRPMNIVVFDHVPVSQQQDIKVTMTAKPQPTKSDVDDKRGVLAWEAKLEPDAEQVIEVGYQVVWPGAKAVTYGK